MWAFLIGGFLTGFLYASRLVQFLRVRDGWVQWHVKIHRRELARIVYSKQWKSCSNLKAFFWKKKCCERIPSRPEFACKFADSGFYSVFQSLQMHCGVFCNLADSSSGEKKKLHTCSYLGPGTKVKEKHLMVNCICDQILSENICRNISHSN